MTAISCAVIPGKVGRNPLDKASETVTTTVRITQAVRDRITQIVGEKGMAAWIRAAVDTELDRQELERRTRPAPKMEE